VLFYIKKKASKNHNKNRDSRSLPKIHFVSHGTLQANLKLTIPQTSYCQIHIRENLPRFEGPFGF